MLYPMVILIFDLFSLAMYGTGTRLPGPSSRIAYAVVTVTLEDRPDGGLRVFSCDLPGLILSGPDKNVVVKQTITAIKALFERMGHKAIHVHPAHSPAEALKRPSPRDVSMTVQGVTPQLERFVVEYREVSTKD